jgi:predicted Zn-dependent protease
LEYLDKTGYDPTAFVSFEKVQVQEKKRPGLLAKALTHPPITTAYKDLRKRFKSCCQRQEYHTRWNSIESRLDWPYENPRELDNRNPKANRPVLSEKLLATWRLGS